MEGTPRTMQSSAKDYPPNKQQIQNDRTNCLAASPPKQVEETRHRKATSEEGRWSSRGSVLLRANLKPKQPRFLDKPPFRDPVSGLDAKGKRKLPRLELKDAAKTRKTRERDKTIWTCSHCHINNNCSFLRRAAAKSGLGEKPASWPQASGNEIKRD